MTENKINYFEIKTDDLIFNHVRYGNIEPEKFAVHTHEVPEIIYINKVQGSYIVEDKEFALKPGDLIISPPAIHHTIKHHINSVYDRYDICFNEKIIENVDLKKIYDNIKVVNCYNHSIIPELFKKTDYYAKNLSPKDFARVSELMFKELFYNLSMDNIEGEKESKDINPILSDAIDYINNNLFLIKSVSEISKHLFITDSYLFEIFKKELNTSPKKYIRSKRLHFARQKILMGKKPTEIYIESGFNDYTSFYRSYVNYFGYSPSQEKKTGISNEKYIDNK